MSKRYRETRQYKVTQAYFKEVLALGRKIDFLEAEIDRRQSWLFLSGVAGGEVVNKTIRGDSLEEGFSMLYESIDLKDTELIATVERRDEAMKVLDNISNSPGYDVVRYRYFEGFRYRDIAKIMGYSEARLFELHREAMYRLYGYLPREYRQKPYNNYLHNGINNDTI